MKKWIPVYGTDDPPPPPPPPPPEPPKTFTQEEVNTFLAEDRRKHKAQVEKYIQDLEKMKESKNLTEKERTTLQQRIDDLNTQVLTKEQQLERERNKLQNEHKSALDKEQADKESWKSRYHDSQIIRAIQDAAIRQEAFSPAQLVPLLKPDARLVEDTDADGQPIGTFSPRVKFRDVDSEGKPVVLDLSIEEAVKRMKELPDQYGNLFKSGLVSGLGGTGSVPGGRFDQSRLKEMDEYKRNRERLVGRKVPGEPR